MRGAIPSSMRSSTRLIHGMDIYNICDMTYAKMYRLIRQLLFCCPRLLLGRKQGASGRRSLCSERIPLPMALSFHIGIFSRIQ